MWRVLLRETFMASDKQGQFVLFRRFGSGVVQGAVVRRPKPRTKEGACRYSHLHLYLSSHKCLGLVMCGAQQD